MEKIIGNESKEDKEYLQNILLLKRRTKRTKIWGLEDDKRLIVLAKEHNYKNWNEIAKSFPGKKPKECIWRYNFINPDIHKGKWSKEEDLKLTNSIATYGKNWKQIKKQFNDRTCKQIKERY